jgi:hypothetical protein
VHVATAGNTDTHVTFVSHPAIDDDPDAIFFVSPALGSSAVENPSAVGVYFEGPTEGWGIFNQDFSPMPEGARFHVVVPPPGPGVFKHAAAALNSTGSRTRLSHPSITSTPSAQFFVTQHWGALGDEVYNDSEVGVMYDGGASTWTIVNEDGSAMPVGAGFNVWVAPDSFVWTSTAADVVGDRTLIDHVSKNGDEDAICLFQHVFSAGSAGGSAFDAHLALRFEASDRWAIVDLSGLLFPEGVDFFVLKP